MRGESCNAWFRDCEYLNQCTLATNRITVPPVANAVLDNKVYDIEVTLTDLINSQLKKVIPIMPIGIEESEAVPLDGDTFL